MALPSTPAAIGIFDSGVGGLSVLRAIRKQLPCQPIFYLADQGHVPYGARTKDEVRSFAEGITRFLLAQGARLIVIACNAASAASLHYLRQTFPDVPFVGMEPAVKPAAAITNSGVIGVLATPVTFQGELYASVVERFAQGKTIFKDTCPGLVAQIESGELDTPKTRAILEKALQPMMDKGMDTVVMGCTHYPFVIPLIQQIVGPNVQVIDPAPAVARQTGHMLALHGLTVNPSANVSAASSIDFAAGEQEGNCPPGVKNPAPMRFFTTGDPSQLMEMLPTLLGEAHVVEYMQWHAGTLH